MSLFWIVFFSNWVFRYSAASSGKRVECIQAILWCDLSRCQQPHFPINIDILTCGPFYVCSLHIKKIHLMQLCESKLKPQTLWLHLESCADEPNYITCPPHCKDHFAYDKLHALAAEYRRGWCQEGDWISVVWQSLTFHSSKISQSSVICYICHKLC